MLKDVWFYIKDFFVKTPFYILVFIFGSIFITFFVFSIEIIFQLSGENLDEPPFTEEELQDKNFVVFYSLFCFLVSIVSGIITVFFRRKLEKYSKVDDKKL